MWDWLIGNKDEVKDALEFLTNYDPYLQFQNIVGWIGNMIGWAWIKFMYLINTGLEKVLLNSFDMAGFLKSQGLTDIQSQFVSTLGFILLVISAILMGIKMIVSKRPPTLKDTITNIVIAVFLLIFSGSIINDLFDISKQSFMDTTQITSDPPSIKLIQDNTDDLTIVLKKQAKNIKEGDLLNKITKDNFKYVDTNELITPDDVDSIADKLENDKAKYLKYKKTTDIDGKVTAVTYKDDWVYKKIAPSGYRRYAANKTVIAVGETSLAVGYIFIIFSIIMCIVELAFKKIYLLVATATDLDTGQRRNKALESVAKSLLLIAFTGLELNIYIRLIEFIGNNTLAPMIQVVAMVVATYFLFKGSQTVSELFGVDTSIKNGAGSLMATMATLSVVKSVGKGVTSGAGAITKKGLNAIRNKGINKDTGDDDDADDDNKKVPKGAGKDFPTPLKPKEPTGGNSKETDDSDTGNESEAPSNDNNKSENTGDTDKVNAKQNQEVDIDKDRTVNTDDDTKLPNEDSSQVSIDDDKQKGTNESTVDVETEQEVAQEVADSGTSNGLKPTRDMSDLDVSDEDRSKATAMTQRDIETDSKTNVLTENEGNASSDLSETKTSNGSSIVKNNSVEHAKVENSTDMKVTKHLDFGEPVELTASAKKLKEQRDSKIKHVMEGARRDG